MLIVLIRLEFLILIILLSIFFIFIEIEINFLNLVYFLVIIVCEGALGVSLLVIIVRIYGNDYLNSLSILKW